MSEATPPPVPSAGPPLVTTPAPVPGARVAAPPGVDFPGKTLGIIGLVLAFISGLIGLILSIVANNQSKAAGYTNTPAKIGIIVGIIVIAIAVVIVIVASVILAGVAAQCAGLGPGVHEVDGIVYNCGIS